MRFFDFRNLKTHRLVIAIPLLIGMVIFGASTVSFAGRLTAEPQPFQIDQSDDEFDEVLSVQPDHDGADLVSGSPSLDLDSASEEAFTLQTPSSLPWRFKDLFETSGKDFSVQSESTSTKELMSILNLPIVRDDKVESHIRFFHIAIRHRFEQWLSRLGHYKPIVENIFSEFNLPSDLVYLSLVESGFNPHAYSRARATGPWQFMRGTAILYGLRVDQYVDERRDPIKSTIAAARYLRDLYDLFGAWPLAMAAYNAGEGKVLRALHKAQAESFSEISKTRLIRRETKEYVPRFMAAAITAKNSD